MGDGGVKTQFEPRVHADLRDLAEPRRPLGDKKFPRNLKIAFANCLTRNEDLWYVNIRLSSRAHGDETRAKTK